MKYVTPTLILTILTILTAGCAGLERTAANKTDGPERSPAEESPAEESPLRLAVSPDGGFSFKFPCPVEPDEAGSAPADEFDFTNRCESGPVTYTVKSKRSRTGLRAEYERLAAEHRGIDSAAKDYRFFDFSEGTTTTTTIAGTRTDERTLCERGRVYLIGENWLVQFGAVCENADMDRCYERLMKPDTLSAEFFGSFRLRPRNAAPKPKASPSVPGMSI